MQFSQIMMWQINRTALITR